MKKQSLRRVFTFFVIVGILAVAITAVAQSSTRGITITEIALAKVMVSGVPEAPVTSFSSTDERIYCFVRLQNTTRQETAIIIGFEPATGEPAPSRAGVRLNVPARWRYRTFARIPNNRPPGQYRCVVRSETGDVLHSANYSVTQ